MENKKICLRIGENRFIININEIYYIESQGRQIIIATKEEKYKVYGDLKKFYLKVADRRFFRCHKAYIVNIDKIKIIRRYGRSYNLILDNNDSIAISRSREKVFRQSFEIDFSNTLLEDTLSTEF